MAVRLSGALARVATLEKQLQGTNQKIGELEEELKAVKKENSLLTRGKGSTGSGEGEEKTELSRKKNKD